MVIAIGLRCSALSWLGEGGADAGEQLPRGHESGGPDAEALDKTEATGENFADDGGNGGNQNGMRPDGADEANAGIGQVERAFNLGKVVGQFLPLPVGLGDQFRAMSGEGVEFGAHGMLLRRLSRSLASSESVAAKRRGLLRILLRRTKMRQTPLAR